MNSIHPEEMSIDATDCSSKWADAAMGNLIFASVRFLVYNIKFGFLPKNYIEDSELHILSSFKLIYFYSISNFV